MKNIYVIVGFNYNHGKNSAYISRTSTIYSKKKKTGERFSARLHFPDHITIKRLHAIAQNSPTNIGYFASLEDAVKSIKESGYYMHEGGYYSTLCIEQVPFGIVDSYGEAVKWFSGRSTGTGFCDYEFRSCRRPRWAKHTFAFNR